MQRFRKQIGFSISRKNQKLADAMLVRTNYDPKERVARWMQEYSKVRGEWVKRQILASSD